MNPNQDDLDRMLQGDDQAPASPAQTEDQGDTTQTVEQQSPEEVEFNSLSGSTQDRIRKLAKDKRELQTQLEQSRMNTYVPPAPNSNFRDPQEEAAIRTLADKGITTDDKLNKVVDERINAVRWELEQGRLESKWHGQQDTPQYVREEVESFIQAHPQYRAVPPEVVFKNFMFPDEFIDFEIERRGTKTGQTTTLRPTKQPVAQEGMTPEYIEQRLQQPDGRQWYDEHLDEINNVLKNMQPA
jgi:hypothetical protein